MIPPNMALMLLGSGKDINFFFFEKKKIELATASNCLKFIDFYALKTTGAALLEI